MLNRVRLQPSGIEFDVESNQTVLEAALANNINLEYSCSNGQCGQCRAVLLEGSVGGLGILSTQSNDLNLSDDEILTCCSKPNSNLVVRAEYYPELNAIERKTVPSKVDGFSFVSHDVMTITLRLPPTVKFSFLAGQFIDLNWNGEKRSYSIASIDAANNKIELHIKKVSGGLFSNYLFNNLELNQLFRIYGPLGTFFLRDSDSPIIFMCTGTGFAPVKAMVEYLISKSSKRQIYIYWGASMSQDLYSDLPSLWSKQYSNIEYLSVLSKEVQSTEKLGVLVSPGDKYIQHKVIEMHENLDGFEVYACGSPKMIVDASKLLIEHGLKPNKFYSDAFIPSN